MAKVYCASFDCIHNKNNVCRSKEINLSCGLVHTVYQSCKHIHECKQYEKSEDMKRIEKMIGSYLRRKGGEV
jgi:hypothetical protein